MNDTVHHKKDKVKGDSALKTGPFWRNCNHCYGRVDAKADAPLYVTSPCGHLCCEKCVPVIKKKGVCEACGNGPVKFIPFGTKMGPDTDIFFEDIQPMMFELYNAMDFQYGQYEHLIKLLRKKVNTFKENCEKNDNVVSILKDRIARRDAEIEDLRQKYSEKDDEITAMETKVEIALQSLSKERKLADSLNEKIQDYENRIQELEEELHHKDKVTTRLESDVKKKDQDLARLRREQIENALNRETETKRSDGSRSASPFVNERVRSGSHHGSGEQRRTPNALGNYNGRKRFISSKEVMNPAMRVPKKQPSQDRGLSFIVNRKKITDETMTTNPLINDMYDEIKWAQKSKGVRSSHNQNQHIGGGPVKPKFCFPIEEATSTPKPDFLTRMIKASKGGARILSPLRGIQATPIYDRKRPQRKDPIAGWFE